MIRSIHSFVCLSSAAFLVLVSQSKLLSEEATEKPTTHTVKIAGNSLQLSAPGTWSVKKPRTRIVAHEFAIPAAKGDTIDGRLTIMAAGGSIAANIERWKSQFSQPADAPKNQAKVSHKEIAGQKVTFVDLSGTYADRPGGPFGPAVPRAGYRMLAAIVQTKAKGNHFIKLYGPAKTIDGAEKHFKGFVESLQASK